MEKVDLAKLLREVQQTIDVSIRGIISDSGKITAVVFSPRCYDEKKPGKTLKKMTLIASPRKGRVYMLVRGVF